MEAVQRRGLDTLDAGQANPMRRLKLLFEHA